MTKYKAEDTVVVNCNVREARAEKGDRGTVVKVFPNGSSYVVRLHKDGKNRYFLAHEIDKV